jgi:hypothetical protein
VKPKAKRLIPPFAKAKISKTPAKKSCQAPKPRNQHKTIQIPVAEELPPIRYNKNSKEKAMAQAATPGLTRLERRFYP